MAPAQKRFTRIILTLGITGSLLIAGLWWDSMRHMNVWRNDKIVAMSFAAYTGIARLENPLPAPVSARLQRTKTHPQFTRNGSLFPKPNLDTTGVRIPYYLILLTHLATLFLTWLLLMNRLARRRPRNQTPAPDQLSTTAASRHRSEEAKRKITK